MVPVLLFLAAQAAPDLAAEKIADVRCLIASSALSASTDKQAASIGIMAGLFWLGRLGMFEEDELERLMTAEALKMTATDINLELQRCGAEMKLRGDAMQRIGDKVQQRAARADTH